MNKKWGSAHSSHNSDQDRTVAGVIYKGTLIIMGQIVEQGQIMGIYWMVINLTNSIT